MKKLCAIFALRMLLTGCGISSDNETEKLTIENTSSEAYESTAYFSEASAGNTQDAAMSPSESTAFASETSIETQNIAMSSPESAVHTSETSAEDIDTAISSPEESSQIDDRDNREPTERDMYTVNTKISDVINDPVFGQYGRLIFPVNSGYYSGDTLGELSLTWYNNIDPDKTVEIVNFLADRAAAGEQVFFDIYTEAEKAADPAKKNTGLFFFKGNENAPFAVCNAGGGFAYVGAMHDSFPHALELSKRGYNAFALIYRPGAQTACEDLARAISFIFVNAEQLGVDTECYSLWGGSAGARMAAYLGSLGTEYFGGDDLPKPGAVIMQYTGHSEYTENDPPTFACVGDSDSIASWRIMKSRVDALASLGIPTEFHVYEGLRHGFGIGTGTVAEGWLAEAVKFWEEQRLNR